MFELPCYFLPLRAKYSPQHPILKQLQPTFLPQYYNEYEKKKLYVETDKICAKLCQSDGLYIGES